MPVPTRGPPLVLQLGLVEVGGAGHELVDELSDRVLHAPVVQVVELLDELERPPSVEHVPTDDLLAQLVSFGGRARPLEQIGGLFDEEVGPTDQLVQRVEVSARPHDVLERLGRLPHRLDQLVGDARRSRPRAAHRVGPLSCHGWERRHATRPSRSRVLR